MKPARGDKKRTGGGGGDTFGQEAKRGTPETGKGGGWRGDDKNPGKEKEKKGSNHGGGKGLVGVVLLKLKDGNGGRKTPKKIWGKKKRWTVKKGGDGEKGGETLVFCGY